MGQGWANFLGPKLSSLSTHPSYVVERVPGVNLLGSTRSEKGSERGLETSVLGGQITLFLSVLTLAIRVALISELVRAVMGMVIHMGEAVHQALGDREWVQFLRRTSPGLLPEDLMELHE